MTLLDALAREHRLFGRLLGWLEGALRREDVEQARGQLRASLLILLPALKKHEEMEHAVFERPDFAASAGAEKALAMLHDQHRKLDVLCEDVKELLGSAERCSSTQLKTLVEDLVARLSAHLAVEEKQLWPHFRAVASRCAEHSVARRAMSRVEALEADLEKSRSMVLEYLGK